MALIHGKQLRQRTLKENLLLVTGSTATNGQILTYDAGSGGFSWVSDTGGVTSVSGGTALDQTATTGNVVLNVRTDNESIYVDSNNDITLGDSNNVITGGDYTFGGSLTVNGNFTVLGTATTINTETLYVEDNIITLNSSFTAGTPTLNAGIEVFRGDEATVQFRWNESDKWWEVTNPEGTGTTYSALLTTSSIESTDAALVVTQGTGGNGDKLFLSVDESNFTNIPNTALVNDSFTTTNDGVVTATTSVALGGVMDVGIVQDSIKESHLNVTNAPTDDWILSYDSGSGGFTWVDPTIVAEDTFSTGGTVTTTPDNNSEAGVITITGNGGFTPYTITGVNDTFVTGTTVDNGAGTITYYKNDGSNYVVDLSSFDFNDTYATGATISNGSLSITGTDGFTTINATGDIIQSITGDSPITASTVNGATTVGIDYSTLQQAVPTSDDKGQAPAATTGNNQSSTLTITNTPARDGHVDVRVNGVNYAVLDNTSGDSYFSDDACSTAVVIASIVSTNVWCWNGTTVGFDLDTDDRVDFVYNINQ